jgi:DNA ligase 1
VQKRTAPVDTPTVDPHLFNTFWVDPLPARTPARLEDLVVTSGHVANTSGRNGKRDLLQKFLADLTPTEMPIAVGLLVGVPRQGRFGVGWSAAGGQTESVATTPTLTLLDVDAAFDELAAMHGPGSNEMRSVRLQELWRRATDDERRHLAAVLVGGLRHGALDGVLCDAAAAATGVTAASLRRAAMLLGDLGAAAALAAAHGQAGIDSVQLQPLRPVQPMLASTSPDVAAAVTAFTSACVEWKLDGIRLQIHRDGEAVKIFTRNLNDVTDRLADAVALVKTFPAQQFVLDAEGLVLAHGGRASAFQDTLANFGSEQSGATNERLQVFCFDLLYVDGVDLLDSPLAVRTQQLRHLVGVHAVPQLVTTDPKAAASFADDALSRGHEGVVVKDLDSPYEAGRRGKSWRKVKPVRTFDLVVLGAEWGHGRRKGWLSNLHLGARVEGPDTDATGATAFAMVGKTFKGLTDELLAWQTDAFLARETGRTGITVFVAPELVVEIAIDGVQRSSRYPGGVALRFARVRRYRPDKSAAEADTLQSLRQLFPIPEGEPEGEQEAP